MDIKELNKTQLILLTLLITFVVSIATGIVTVTLMQQMPKSATQTITNVIQRTIERVNTVTEVSTDTPVVPDTKETNNVFLGDGDALVSIYAIDEKPVDTTTITTPIATVEEPKALGQGVIISDIGLILVDTSILNEKEVYKVILNKVDYDATLLKRFTNGFAILKISKKGTVEDKKEEEKVPEKFDTTL